MPINDIYKYTPYGYIKIDNNDDVYLNTTIKQSKTKVKDKKKLT